ncbi:MAG: DUF2892 domain-containing protein [Leptospirales bacterium]|nr:DUF2892 domain-containing protein [Leptospirales bacterium]
MKQNMGSSDSYIRVMIGIAFYVNILALQPSLCATGAIILFALGTLCMVTAWTKVCPAYGPLGICTCSGECECSGESGGSCCSAGGHGGH